ncbi:MAG TPA: GNAT family N-acetyltransferase [Bryobacteraceae bacterium]|jgi:RimJ/RimL family protein N-acetyltransferase
MIRTARLLLRQWRPEDREPFAAMGQDPAVMEYFPSLLSRSDSDAGADRAEAGIAQNGFGFWAVEIPGEAPFAGFIGLNRPRFETHFTPCIEIGWRLARPFWGCGYATEGAAAALDFGFNNLGLEEIVSFAVVDNARSMAVMRRIGMTYSEQFDHPDLEKGHRLRRHVLYRISKSGWRQISPAVPVGGGL